jgi:hypothetical protein
VRLSWKVFTNLVFGVGWLEYLRSINSMNEVGREDYIKRLEEAVILLTTNDYGCSDWWVLLSVDDEDKINKLKKSIVKD